MRWMPTTVLLVMAACGGQDIANRDQGTPDESNPTEEVSAPLTVFAAGARTPHKRIPIDPGKPSHSHTPDPGGATTDGGSVTIHLEKTFDGAGTISFGVPLPPGAASNVSQIRVSAGSTPLAANVKELLAEHGPTGERTGLRSVLVQLPASAMAGATLDVEVSWGGGAGSAPGATIVPFGDAAVSADSPLVVDTTERSISQSGGSYQLTEGTHVAKTLFVGREPRVLASFPEGYLAHTGLLGQQRTENETAAGTAKGYSYVSNAMREYSLSAMYQDGYALNPDPESVIDPVAGYEGWLYDRCATFLTAYIHLGDARFLRHAYKSCAHFADQIELSGANRGIFNGKPDPDTKYSHLRGLFAYYALTGDEKALEAGKAIADMWLAEPLFVAPYRQGHVRGPDKLWTERLLATSLEGLYYGHALTGDVTYLSAFDEMLATAHRHITGNAADLAAINPGFSFPPQNCFVHSALQHSEGDGDQPWCSPWMSELLVDPLLRYQEQTNDPRVDDILVRLGRFLRDVGTSYFDSDPVDDTFLNPSICDNPAAGDNRRRLIPLYGAALDASNQRRNFGEWSDMEHCSDATALTAAAIRALKRQGTYDQNPIGPFASEGESLLALHEELASCAERVFSEETRPMRDPANWTSAQLAQGASSPDAFIESNRIGFPVHVITPQRKISWWFNTSMLGMGMIDEAGVPFSPENSGAIQASGCQ